VCEEAGDYLEVTTTTTDKIFTKEEMGKVRILARQIGADDLALALQDRLEQEIRMAWNSIRGNTDSRNYWTGYYKALNFCHNLIHEFSEVEWEE
jgi:hypothetical protein